MRGTAGKEGWAWIFILVNDASNTEKFEWSQVWKAFRDPKVWLYCAHFHTLSLPLYTLSLFLVSLMPYPSL